VGLPLKGLLETVDGCVFRATSPARWSRLCTTWFREGMSLVSVGGWVGVWVGVCEYFLPPTRVTVEDIHSEHTHTHTLYRYYYYRYYYYYYYHPTTTTLYGGQPSSALADAFFATVFDSGGRGFLSSAIIGPFSVALVKPKSPPVSEHGQRISHQ
jgi:hypothetical protein